MENKEIISVINKAIEKKLRQNGIYNKRLFKELSDSTYDEYLLNLELKKTEKESLLNALDSMNATIDSNYRTNKFNKSRFSLFVSSIALIATLIIAIIGWLNTDILYIFNVIYPIFAFITLIYFIYVIVTYKKRSYLDFIVLGIIFISVLAITIQCFVYFYRSMTGNYYYELYYDFPGLLKYCTYWLVSMEPINYELSSTIFLFDPTLIASFVCFCLSLIMYLIEKRKKRISNNIN